MTSEQLAYLVLGGAGLALYALPSPTGWIKRLWSGGSAAADDPDDRKAFTDRLHWLTEFARSELRDAEMVSHLNSVHERFTRIPEETVSER